MIKLPTFRRWAAASFAAAAVLFGGGAAAQSQAGFVPSEEDVVLLQLHVRNVRMMQDLRGYQTPEGVCVDMADVIQSLDLPIRLDKKSRRATGWIFAEDEKFSIDRDSNRVQTVNNTRSLQPGELYDTPEGWCVDTDALGGWFGVTFTPSLRNSALTLQSERPLPFLEALERKSRAARLRGDRDDRRDLAAYPQARQPYSMWRMPSVDVMAQADYRSASGRGQLTRRFDVFASGEAAMVSYNARLSSDQRGNPETLRVRAFRMDPEGRMLGPLKATQVAAGDVDLLSGELAGENAVGRGVFLSNRALTRSTRFGTTVLRGALPLGWDAELYRNGQLLAYQGGSTDGRYEFEVGLVYGRNELEVVLYGPQGQVRRESQSIPVGFDALPPGKLEYWAGVIQRDRDLISFGRPPPMLSTASGWQYAAGVQYGLDRRTLIGASAHSLYLDARRRDYAELNVQRAVGPMLLNLSAAQQFGAGRAYHADLLGRIGGISIQAESLIVDGDFVSGIVNKFERSAHSLQFEAMPRVGRIPLPVSAMVRRTTERDGRKVNEVLARAALMLPRMALTGFVIHRDAEGGYDDEEGTKVGLLANTRFLGVQVRGETSYRLSGPHRGFDEANVTFEKALSDRSDLRFEVQRSARRRMTEFEVAYVRQFREFAMIGSGLYDTRGGFGVGLAVNFSLGPDELDGGWRLSSGKLAQRGQAAVSVFLDRNGDGYRSADEQALAGVGITAGNHGAAEPTNERGHAYVEGLMPYEKVLVSVDESTLPDPFLMPRGRGIVVTPRPGVAAMVEIAVAPTGEVEGVINGPENTPLAGVELELVDARGQVMARAMSEFDGFFLFDRVAYGRYRLQLAAESQAALGVVSEVAATVELSAEKTLERLGTIRLRAAATIAQARGPPTGASP